MRPDHPTHLSMPESIEHNSFPDLVLFCLKKKISEISVVRTQLTDHNVSMTTL
jgi:hypothetical protein